MSGTEKPSVHAAFDQIIKCARRLQQQHGMDFDTIGATALFETLQRHQQQSAQLRTLAETAHGEQLAAISLGAMNRLATQNPFMFSGMLNNLLEENTWLAPTRPEKIFLAARFLTEAGTYRIKNRTLEASGLDLLIRHDASSFLAAASQAGNRFAKESKGGLDMTGAHNTLWQALATHANTLSKTHEDHNRSHPEMAGHRWRQANNARPL